MQFGLKDAGPVVHLCLQGAFLAQLTDFGLSRVIPEGQSFVLLLPHFQWQQASGFAVLASESLGLFIFADPLQ